MNFHDEVEGTQLQARLAPAYHARGLEAPRRVYGESLAIYHRRLLDPLLADSKFAGANLYRVPDSVLPAVEQAAVAGTIAKARAPTGPLREIKEQDQTGRTITRFFGDCAETWAPFKAPLRNVVGIGRAR